MQSEPTAALRHRIVEAPAGRLHLVEQGTGPLVLLVHGFPESWYSWRRQLPALAAAGYRAVAIDVRGYGRSSKPAATDAYRMLDLVEDNVAVVRALGEESAVIVGHDWGSNIASASALIHPEIVRAVGLLSVPYAPPGGPRPTDIFGQIGGPEQELYVSYFQEPGRAETEIEPDVRSWLAGFYAALSADTMPAHDEPDPHFVALGCQLRDRFPAGPLPAWLTEDDLDVYAGEFERTGLTGALNRYRNMDRDWEDLAPTAEPRSHSPPCSSAAHWMPPPPGWPTPSTPTPPPSPPCPPPTSWTAAATGSSRNAPTRSTAC
ncbi:hypothetical protein GCM10020295_00860 [Streptomyces cinereospinus]